MATALISNLARGLAYFVLQHSEALLSFASPILLAIIWWDLYSNLMYPYEVMDEGHIKISCYGRLALQ